MRHLLRTQLCFQEWDRYDLRDLDYVLLGGICMIYLVDLLHIFAWVGSV